MANYDCDCWHDYPNPLRKRDNGTSPCDNYVCVQHMDRSGKGKKTHCIKKERLQNEQATSKESL